MSTDGKYGTGKGELRLSSLRLELLVGQVRAFLHQLSDQGTRHFRRNPEGPPGKRTTFVKNRL